MHKTCSKCHSNKPINSFHKNKRKNDGFENICKECTRHRVRDHYYKNKECRKNYIRRWKKSNWEHEKERKRKYYKENRERMNAHVGQWRARFRQATPSWASRSEILSIYKLAHSLNMVVDHIVPLSSKLVCGLHCEENMRVIPSSLNSYKSNRYWPNMPEPTTQSKNRNSNKAG